MASTAQTLSEMIKKQASKVWPKQQPIPKIETNWNLYEILKAWPSKSQATLPLKTEPIFVPSKLSEAPITLSSVISWYNKTKANLSDLIQKPISNITNTLSNKATDIAASWFENLWQQLQKEVERNKEFQKSSNPLTKTIWYVWEAVWTPISSTVNSLIERSKELWNDVASWKVSEAAAKTEIFTKSALWWLSVTPVPYALNLLTDTWLKATWTKEWYENLIKNWETIATNAVQNTLWISPEKAKNYTNIALDILRTIGAYKWSKKATSWWFKNATTWLLQQNAVDLTLLAVWLWSKWENKTLTSDDVKNWIIAWIITTAAWFEPKWKVKTQTENFDIIVDRSKTKPVILPDNLDLEKQQIETDKIISEKQWATKTTKLSKDELNQFIEAKKTSPDLTPTDFLNQKLSEIITKKPDEVPLNTTENITEDIKPIKVENSKLSKKNNN